MGRSMIAAKLRPGGEFRFGTDHPVYVRHALMVMRRHREQFEWLCDKPRISRSARRLARNPLRSQGPETGP
jgi:tRNA G46 methylase TrmB